MLPRTGAVSGSVVGFIQPVISSAVIVIIANGNDKFILFAGDQKFIKNISTCRGISGRFSGKFAIAVHTAPPHGRAHSQCRAGEFFRYGKAFAVIPGTDEKTAGGMGQKSPAHGKVRFTVIRIEPGGQTEKILFIKKFIVIVPITGRNHFSGIRPGIRKG